MHAAGSKYLSAEHVVRTSFDEWPCRDWSDVCLQGKDSAEAKEIAAILAEEKVELVPEEDKDKLHELDSFTGQPRPDDILLFAIPVRSTIICLQNRHFDRPFLKGSGTHERDDLRGGPAVLPSTSKAAKTPPYLW